MNWAIRCPKVGAETIYAGVRVLRGIDPWRSVGVVKDLKALVELGQWLLDPNKTRTTGDTRPGRQSWVYGRAGQPCRRCGTTIRRGEQGPIGKERVRFWCPSCQR